VYENDETNYLIDKERNASEEVVIDDAATGDAERFDSIYGQHPELKHF
jgi:hypothetical protein